MENKLTFAEAVVAIEEMPPRSVEFRCSNVAEWRKFTGLESVSNLSMVGPFEFRFSEVQPVRPCIDILYLAYEAGRKLVPERPLFASERVVLIGMLTDETVTVGDIVGAFTNGLIEALCMEPKL